MKVIIIDDGINEKFVGINKLYVNIEITSDLKITTRKNYNQNEASHGSICAKIILRYYNKCELGSIKILGDEVKYGGNEQLIVALELCKSIEARIINMSLGSRNLKYYNKISKQIAHLSFLGKIIVGACNIDDIFSMPSNFPNVIGVGTDYGLENEQSFYNLCAANGKDIIASSKHIIIGSSYSEYSTSYATAYISAEVCKLIDDKNNINICNLKRMMAKERYQKATYCLIPMYIQNAVILAGENLEPQALEKLKINKKIVNLSRKDNNLLKLKEMSDLIILPFNQTGFLELVIKYLQENRQNIFDVIYCGTIPLKLKKFIEEEMNCFLWYENISEEFFTKNVERKCTLPIVAVLSTEKNSMQNISLLKEGFLVAGYRAVTVSDRKYSYLSNIDYYCNKLNENAYLYCEKYYQADIILEDQTSTSYKSNLNIVISDNINDYIISIDEKTTIYVNNRFFINNVSKIINQIESIFENNC